MRFRLVGRALLVAAVICAYGGGAPPQAKAGTSAPTGAAPKSVVVSVRVLQIKGRSHHHLYLYRGDGTLARELTTGTGFDNRDPVFSPDGRVVAFHRRSVARRDATPGDTFLMNVDGTHLRKCEDTSGPAWMRQPRSMTPMDGEVSLWRDEGDAEITQTSASFPAPPVPPTWRAIPSPDGRWEVRRVPSGKADTAAGVFMWDRQEETTIPLAKCTGFQSADWLVAGATGDPWLRVGGRCVFVYAQHMGSTYGNAYYAVSPESRELIDVASGGASILTDRQLSGFFLLEDSRYEALGDGRTVNCTYLTWWGPGLKSATYSKPLGVFGGACIRLTDGVNLLVPR